MELYTHKPNTLTNRRDTRPVRPVVWEDGGLTPASYSILVVVWVVVLKFSQPDFVANGMLFDLYSGMLSLM